MYASFFGLQHQPFSIAPDPRYLFMSERHREALAHLLYGLGGGGGFVLLTGEIGAGKTTVCRCFLEQIPPRCNVAYIFNPKLTVPELLHAVCEEFRIPHRHDGPGSETVKDYVDPLNEYLLRTHAVGQNNVLIIDEAQNLSADVLEQLRLLTNLETSERKLLQIILIGQPELREMLARPELEQLAQRVIARFHLQALSEAETAQYIQHRLGVAGLSGATPLERKAVLRIHQLTRGVPRRINLLCDRALLGAYAGGQPRVNRAIVEQAAREVFDLRPGDEAALSGDRRAAPPLGWLGAGAAGGLALIVLGAWALQGGSGRAGPALRGAGAASASVAKASAPAAPASAARAALAASAPAPAASAQAAPAFDLQAGFASLASDPREAWRELLPLWGVPAGTGDPCDAAARVQVLCDSHPSSLATIRLLARPGVLTLHGEHEQVVYAVLTGLGSQSATLRIAGTDRQVPLPALAALWRGDFATLWRAPPGYGKQRQDSASGAAARWLGRQLGTLQAPAVAASDAAAEVSLKSRIYAFQASQGLPPDGLAGPFTFMQLNRALGIDEPRLHSEP